MRSLLIGTKEILEKHTEYYILAEDDQDAYMETYGLKIVHGESVSQVCRITQSSDKIQTLALRLMEGLVTPITLRDVIEDWVLC